MDESTQKGEKKEAVSTYSKSALLKSSEFKDKKDLICVLLDDDKLYEKKEVYSIIKNYLKRRGF